MKNIVGTPARGDHFFPRNTEVEKILISIQNDNNLQVAAPRRVGKTSILLHLLDNSIDNYHYVYVDTENINNEQEFFKKLLKTLVKDEKISKNRKLQSFLEKGGKLFERIKSINILGHGLDLHEQGDTDYYEDLCNFLCGYEPEDGNELVLLIDEFPQTILNIVEADNGDNSNAKHFLQSNREMRLNPDIQKKVRFIYTGSIGLNHTVSSIQCSAFVNDLNTIEIDTLAVPEATSFAEQLLKSVKVSSDAIPHLILKIKWLIPFHIQLVVQEILNAYRRDKVKITPTIVDNAFDNIIANKHNNHFKHYYDRLGFQLKGASHQYAALLLDQLADGEMITKAIAADMAIPFGLENSYRNILEMLAYDGYITYDQQTEKYRFNSPLLELWWKKFICK